jgi:hypothetical protein
MHLCKIKPIIQILSFIALCFLTFYSCVPKKRHKDTLVLSYVSLTTDGVTYYDTLGQEIDGGYVTVVPDSQWSLTDDRVWGCRLNIEQDQSVLDFRFRGSPAFPYTIQLINVVGPPSGVGKYKITKAHMNKILCDTTAKSGELPSTSGPAAFIAYRKESRYYPVDSAEIHITKAAGESVEATYVIWTTNSGLAQTLTGTISWHFATIRKVAPINYDKALVATLDSLMINDQANRILFDSITSDQYNSPMARALWSKIAYQDSLNLIVAERILRKYGWAGPKVFTPNGNLALFLVIQHADYKTQKRYLPMLQAACKKNHINASEVAMLEDRIAMTEGRKQRFGSQIRMHSDGRKWIYPLEDPDHIDKIRAEVGLDSFNTYLGALGMKWNLEAYKRQLSQIERWERELRNK